jgi:hypothetical protein
MGLPSIPANQHDAENKITPLIAFEFRDAGFSKAKEGKAGKP